MSNLAKLQSLCKEMELDAIMLTNEVNRRYVTGMHTSDGLALITPDTGYFVTDFRYIEAAREKLTGFEVKMRTREETYHMIVEGLVSELRLKRVGFEEDHRTVAAHEGWQKKLADIEWVGVREGMARVRAVKEQWEIERMVAAQRIAERAFKNVLNLIKKDMTEREIASELIYHMLKYGADKISFDPIVVSGPNSSLPHGEPGDRKIQSGDFITMDFGCMSGGYCSDMTRTIAIGHASDEMCAVYDTVLKAQAAGIAAAKSGVAGADIHNAAADVIGAAGYGEFFGHGFGHGIGLEVHEDYNAAPTEKKILQSGMVISAEPGIYLPGKFGVRIEDVIVIGVDGALNLMECEKTLVIL